MKRTSHFGAEISLENRLVVEQLISRHQLIAARLEKILELEDILAGANPGDQALLSATRSALEIEHELLTNLENGDLDTGSPA